MDKDKDFEKQFKVSYICLMELTFNEHLEVFLKRKGMTKEEFGEELDIARPTVYWKIKHGNWTDEEIKIMGALGINTDLIKKN